MENVSQKVRYAIESSCWNESAKSAFCQVEHLNEKLNILTQVQDTCSRCTKIAQSLLSKQGGTVDSQSPPAFPEVVTSDEESEESDCDSVVVALRTSLVHIRAVSEAASELVANHKRRQSKWLALSSQLAACPLGKAPNLDLHSWLSQVKDGKISGAGHDACSASAATDGTVGYLTAIGKNVLSDMIFDFDEFLSNGDSWDCLMDSREDMKLSAPFLSGAFIIMII